MHRRMQLLEQMVKPKPRAKKKENITTLDLDKPVYAKLSKIAAKHALSARKYGMHLVKWNIDKFDLIERIYPFLSKDHIGPKSVFINDYRDPYKTIEVRFENSPKEDNVVIYKCLVCENSDCEHCKFSLMLPELGQLVLEKKTKNSP